MGTTDVTPMEARREWVSSKRRLSCVDSSANLFSGWATEKFDPKSPYVKKLGPTGDHPDWLRGFTWHEPTVANAIMRPTAVAMP